MKFFQEKPELMPALIRQCLTLLCLLLIGCTQHRSAVRILRNKQAANYTAIHAVAKPYPPEAQAEIFREAPKLIQEAESEAEAIRILQGHYPP